MSSSAIGRKVASGELIRIRLRIYLVGGCPLSWEARLTAASLAYDPPAAISHRSAAAVWGFETFEPGPVEVTTERPLRDVGGVAHRSKTLLPAQVTHHRGFFLTTPSQTLIELGAVTSPERVAAALDSALLQGLTSLPYLSKHLDRFGGRGRPGTGLLRRLIEERQKGSRTESELERVFDRNVVRPGALPRPLFQYRIFDGEEFIARRDFVYLYEMVAIEVDGWRFHAGLEAWQRDLATDNRLIALGWVVLRFTWDDVTKRPDQVIRRIRQVLEQRGQATLEQGNRRI
ncbi:MAG: endonuclease domain-containing protein [Actinomycetota bacterium]|nr:endonuclease domain-containing protein [Actinomycetota bacterium]